MEARKQKLDNDLVSRRRELRKAEDEQAEENCYRRIPKKRTTSEAGFDSPHQNSGLPVADNGKRMKASLGDSGSKDATESMRILSLKEAAAASFHKF